MKTAAWPVLKRYDAHHLARLALPLGGIGTGTISLGGRGDLRDWEIINRPAKGFCPTLGGIAPSFVLRVKPPAGPAIGRLLEGPLPHSAYEGPTGAMAPNHGLPRFRHCQFAAAYPLGQVRLSDPDVPVTARLEAFNPLIPADADSSGWPLVALRYALTNRTGKTLDAALCGTIPNFIGNDGTTCVYQGNRNEFRQTRGRGRGLHGLHMSADGLDHHAMQWGTMALCVLGQRDAGVSFRTAWARQAWSGAMLQFWEDFLADGRLEECADSRSPLPLAALATRFRIPARGTRAVTFLITWHFPNRGVWNPQAAGEANACGPIVGNHYATRFRDAWHVAEQAAPCLARLEAGTVRFVRAFCASELPPAVKDAALANLTALRSQTSFRTPDGFLFGWEGCHDRAGCCHGSCTHVWNYENAVGFLFGELSRGMRRVEFEHATGDDGLMSFRVELPLSRASTFGKAAADGQMGAIMRCYRDWRLSGDDDFLRSLWPKVRKALEYCWIAGGWDADQDGVMEGCQHNTMDVEYYGPNPQMGIWYLGALRACEEMARHLGEAQFAARCRGLFERGRGWIDKDLFNGEYYEHQVRPPAGPVAPALQAGMGGSVGTDPEFQLGAGCLVDQLVGQYMAHAVGLGHLVDPRHARTTLRSIMKYNFRPDLHGHFNHMRSFALHDESGLLMATYPRGRRPAKAFPYWTEVMTGFEYTAAVGMLYEGLTADGLRCIQAIRRRYDGARRSPWDEAECGHHYARAMASWTAVLALTGFHYDGVTGTMEFAASSKPVSWFWSTGQAWGTLRQSGQRVQLRVLHGHLKLKRLVVKGRGEVTVAGTIREPAGTLETRITPAGQQ